MSFILIVLHLPPISPPPPRFDKIAKILKLFYLIAIFGARGGAVG